MQVRLCFGFTLPADRATLEFLFACFLFGQLLRQQFFEFLTIVLGQKRAQKGNRQTKIKRYEGHLPVRV
ncbi:MAG TPA: hypothetical protein DEA89_00635 [Candidatus Moranbacteria bacterium]|nr:hypothetical protein [Candidatus Moranbacteria bacterium]HBI50885.1 hypothetical protein [Candidatus Moranbacteria bacterium]HBU10414.1 hypothetical protein [Candidatus Moranbacteria bacterium]